ncbi:MAG: hypothetical protein BWX80_02416 [Candidatus Hydrogenedentes bacterium ADurb.Bin101]|nr:MAG: hypothetical protein BWX80_02416 [Candidatus Hydrogenedentes bacterium ADurb.Bin101]
MYCRQAVSPGVYRQVKCSFSRFRNCSSDMGERANPWQVKLSGSSFRQYSAKSAGNIFLTARSPEAPITTMERADGVDIVCSIDTFPGFVAGQDTGQILWTGGPEIMPRTLSVYRIP